MQQQAPNTVDSEHKILIGKIGAPYGIKGWVKIMAFNDSGNDILDYKPWFLGDNRGNWKIADIESAKVYGKGYIAKFVKIDNPEDAKILTGKSLGINRSQLRSLPQDEFYWADLEGLTVINHEGKTLGTIIYLIETGSNDVIVVKGEKEHALPYLMGEVIKRVDLEARTMYVEWEEL
jgi:16S rRNA processing protein RimM